MRSCCRRLGFLPHKSRTEFWGWHLASRLPRHLMSFHPDMLYDFYISLASHEMFQELRLWSTANIDMAHEEAGVEHNRGWTMVDLLHILKINRSSWFWKSQRCETLAARMLEWDSAQVDRSREWSSVEAFQMRERKWDVKHRLTMADCCK